MYIDGMIVFDVEESSVQELLGNLGMQIRIEDKSVSELFLGRKKRITVLKKDTSKMQSKKNNMQIFKPVYEPVVTSKNATDDNSINNRSSFQQLVGALMYFIKFTLSSVQKRQSDAK